MVQGCQKAIPRSRPALAVFFSANFLFNVLGLKDHPDTDSRFCFPHPLSSILHKKKHPKNSGTPKTFFSFALPSRVTTWSIVIGPWVLCCETFNSHVAHMGSRDCFVFFLMPGNPLLFTVLKNAESTASLGDPPDQSPP